MATTKKQYENDNIVPRVSILEKGQEAIQRDLVSLSHAVKDQGLQLTNALTKLTEAHHSSFDIIQEKIANNGKTDWQSFWTMIGTLAIIIAAIMSPIWMSFNYVDRTTNEIKESIKEQKTTQIENIKNIATIKAELNCIKGDVKP